MRWKRMGDADVLRWICVMNHSCMRGITVVYRKCAMCKYNIYETVKKNTLKEVDKYWE